MTTARDQITWQRRAAALLGELLTRAEAERLPVLAWQIDAGRALLTGHSLAPSNVRRRADVSAWRTALGASAIAEDQSITGVTGLLAEAPHYDGLVTVAIRTSLYDEGGPP